MDCKLNYYVNEQIIQLFFLVAGSNTRKCRQYGFLLAASLLDPAKRLDVAGRVAIHSVLKNEILYHIFTQNVMQFVPYFFRLKVATLYVLVSVTVSTYILYGLLDGSASCSAIRLEYFQVGTSFPPTLQYSESICCVEH